MTPRPSPSSATRRRRSSPSSSLFGSTSAIGRVQKHYLISTRVLGSGKFGEVRQATCIETGRQVAVKTVDKTRLSPKQRKNLHREVQIMRMIEHSDIVALIEHFEDSSLLIIVMELCEGVDLYERITSRGRFTEAEARSAMRSILRAISHLHARGVSHRDIKPENFMTNRHNEDLKLIDFGLSKTSSAAGGNLGRPTLKRMRSRVGTPYYIAPEVLQGGDYDQSIDNWSAGVVLYIMLAGFAPFNGHSDREIFHEIKHSKVDFSSSAFDGVSAEAKQLIKSLLQRDSYRRLTAAKALEHPFFDYPEQAQTAENGKRTLQAALFSEQDSSVVQKNEDSSSSSSSTSTSLSFGIDPAASPVPAPSTPNSATAVNSEETEDTAVNNEVFYLDLDWKFTTAKTPPIPQSLKARIRRMGKQLWNMMETHPFGQLVSKHASVSTGGCRP